MDQVGETAEPFVILAAWHCDPCDVQGRSMVADGVACWNCGGSVTVTARPAIPAEDLGPTSAFDRIPTQRTPDDLAAA
jgi:hypothetical protein